MKLALSIMLLLASPVYSSPIIDAVGDFLPTYTGPLGDDLDFVSGNVTRSGGSLQFDVEMVGNFGTTPNVLVVFAIDRGAGTPRLTFLQPPILPGLPFDSLFVMFTDGTGRVVNFVGQTPTITVLPGVVDVSDNRMHAMVSGSLFPSTGFDLADYTFDAWTRQRINPQMDSGNFEVADALNDGNPFLATVPEPAIWACMILGFGAIGLRLRRGVPGAQAGGQQG